MIDRETRDLLLSVGLGNADVADYAVDQLLDLVCKRLIDLATPDTADRRDVYKYAQPYAGIVLEPPRENISGSEYVLKAIKNYAKVMLVDDDEAWLVPDEDQQKALDSNAAFPRVERRCAK